MDEAIDETGTVPCSIVGDDVEGRVHVEEQLRKEIREVSDYLLEVHGVPPGRKGEGGRLWSPPHSIFCHVDLP